MKLPSFAEVAHRLRDRFDGASKVIARNDGTSFMTEGLSIKPPTKQDLVYTDESPEFCVPNPKTGSLGKTRLLIEIHPSTIITDFVPQESRTANAT
jgi:wingless-type MMTV integration site family, member 6